MINDDPNSRPNANQVYNELLSIEESINNKINVNTQIIKKNSDVGKIKCTSIIRVLQCLYDSIKENIVPKLTEKQKQYVYADEADVINVALFGQTAKEWRENNPNLKGNIRDYTDILHLVILSNLEVLNANMIDNNISQSKRLEKLNETARKELSILANDRNIIGIEKIDNKNLIE